MNLQQFITKYNGQKVGDGQCGTLVRAYWTEVDKTNPPSYPDSKDYWFNPVPGYSHTSTPKAGDIAIYNGHGVYTEGHSAIYVGPGVFEQNADPDGSPAHVYTRANTYLLGYLTKGENMSLATKDDVDRLFLGMLGHAPSPEQESQNIGKDLSELIEFIMGTPERAAYATKVENALAGTAEGTVLAPGNYQVK